MGKLTFAKTHPSHTPLLCCGHMPHVLSFSLSPLLCQAHCLAFAWMYYKYLPFSSH